MKRITPAELETLLSGLSQPMSLALVILTLPSMTCTDNPYIGRVQKKSWMRVRINADYGKEMNDHLESLGMPRNFTAKPRPWGTYIPGTPLIEHRGEKYLSAIVDVVLNSQYLVDGKLTPKATLEKWLRDKPYPPVAPISPKLCSIVEVVIDGQPYSVAR